MVCIALSPKLVMERKTEKEVQKKKEHDGKIWWG